MQSWISMPLWLFHSQFNWQSFLRTQLNLDGCQSFVVAVIDGKDIASYFFPSPRSTSLQSLDQQPFCHTFLLPIGYYFTTTAKTIICLCFPTSAASPEVLSVFCCGPLGIESWCCEMEECPHSSALFLLQGLRSLAPSSSTLLCGSETKPAFKKKKEREDKKQNN